MRAGTRRVAVVAALVALVMFAVPLALVSRALLIERERAELGLAAHAALTSVGVNFSTSRAAHLPPTDPGVSVAVYDTRGVLRAGNGGSGPGRLARAAMDGSTLTGWEGGRLVAVIPVVSHEDVIGVVRASEPGYVVWEQVGLVWGLLAAAAAAALAAAIIVARHQARRLVEPLEALAAASQQVTQGDLSSRARPSRVPEVDQLGRAHNTMVDHLVSSLERERHFASDASHQLRTPLARLQLRVEAARDRPESAAAELDGVLEDLDQLQQTVDQMLAVARRTHNGGTPSQTEVPVGQLIATVEQRWHGPLGASGRELTIRVAPDVAGEPVAAVVATQVLEVLLDNAARHGRGGVVVVARDSSGAVAIDVSDEGSLPDQLDPFERGTTTSSRGTGLGLALARTMAESIQARLTITSRSPATLSLFMPINR